MMGRTGWVFKMTPIDIWITKPTKTDEYILCHNDLPQQDTVVCRDSLKIRVIIDWELDGWRPERFEKRYHTMLRPSVALHDLSHTRKPSAKRCSTILHVNRRWA